MCLRFVVQKHPKGLNLPVVKVVLWRADPCWIHRKLVS